MPKKKKKSTRLAVKTRGPAVNPLDQRGRGNRKNPMAAIAVGFVAGHDPLPLEPPAFLDPIASAMWVDIARIQHDLRARGEHWITAAAAGSMAVFCNAYSRWQQLLVAAADFLGHKNSDLVAGGQLLHFTGKLFNPCGNGAQLRDTRAHYDQ